VAYAEWHVTVQTPTEDNFSQQKIKPNSTIQSMYIFCPCLPLG